GGGGVERGARALADGSGRCDRPVPALPDVPGGLLEVRRSGMVNDADTRPSAEEVRARLPALSIQPPPVPADNAVRVPPEPVSKPESWSMPTQPRRDGHELTDELAQRPAQEETPPVANRR